MSFLFKRKYILTLGKPTLIEKNVPFRAEKLTEGREFVLTQHNISFSIDKTNTPSNNSASITITNTSDGLVDYLEQNAGLSTYIKLEVGYGDQPVKELFLGEVKGVEDVFVGATRSTKLECGDGYTHLKEQRTARSYRKGTTISRILDDMTVDLGLPKGTFIPPEGEIGNSRSYNGITKEIMTTIAKDIGYNFSVQDNRVNMVPFQYSGGPTVKVINPTSGMIGSPTPIDTGSGQLEKSKGSKRGVRVKCLIDASVRPDSIIIIESRKYNGTFKVNKVSFNGELEGTNWEMDIECEPVGGN